MSRTSLAWLLTVILVAAPSAAQTPSRVRVIVRGTPVVLSPHANREVIMTAVQGTVFDVLDKEGNWYWVMLAPDANGTRRPGWVAAQDVEIVTATVPTAPDDARLEDLTQQVERLERQLNAVRVFTPAPAPVAPTAAQPVRRFVWEFEHVWIDVNLGLARAATSSYTTTLRDIRFEELATFKATYHLPKGADVDVGGGYLVTPRVGFGVSITGTAHRDKALLYIEIPHPTIFDVPASDTARTNETLARTEGGVHLQAMLVAAQSPRLRVRVFGGPSFFRVTQDTVSFIRYEQAALLFVPVNAVEITTFDTVEHEATGWGFHVGADVTTFFTRVVGVGGFVRLSRASLSLPDFGGPSDITAGGVQVGGGLRVKF